LDLDEVAVFGDDDSLNLAGSLEDLGILGSEETEIFDMESLALPQIP
jgi:hypothetical protein